MLGQDRNVYFGVLDKVEVEEPNIGLVEIDSEVLVVLDRNILHPLLDVRCKDQFWRVAQQLKGVFHIARRERLAVIPFDALADLYIDALEVGSYLVAFRKPRNLRTIIVVVEIQEFVHS